MSRFTLLRNLGREKYNLGWHPIESNYFLLSTLEFPNLNSELHLSNELLARHGQILQNNGDGHVELSRY